MFERDREPALSELLGLWLNDEASPRAEGEGRDLRILSQLWLIVGVHAHVVLAIAVAIQEYVVEIESRSVFHTPPEALQNGAERPGRQHLTGVAIRPSSGPGDKAGLEDLSAEHGDRPLLPLELFDERPVKPVGLIRRNPGVEVDPGPPTKLATRHSEPLLVDVEVVDLLGGAIHQQ